MAGRTTGGAGSSDALRRLDALAQVTLRLAGSAPSGRVLLAQLALGLDPRWVPRPWGEDLLAAMDDAHSRALEPLSFRDVERTLKSAWGGRATDELDSLDSDPVAVTPTSQVHRGVLDGAPVAVKVRRPGLARSVRQDLSLLDSVLAPLGAALPALDGRAVLREIADRVRDEYDSEHEAAGARTLSRWLRDHPRLVVPPPVTRLAGEDVLVRSWVDGRRLDEVGEPTRDAAAAALVEFVLGSAPAGIMNAGLTVDDVLVLEDGRVAIVDQARWCPVARDRLPATLALVEAFLAEDPAEVSGALERLGWSGADQAPVAVDVLSESLGPLLGPGPARLDVDAVLQSARRAGARRDELLAVVRSTAPPAADLWPLRGVAQLFATIARVGATGDWPQLVVLALRPSDQS